MRLPKLWGGWRLRVVALLIGLSVPLWKAWQTYGGASSTFASPRLHLWDIADFGILHYDFPGQLPNGEAVILHIWIKALRSENSILLRAVGAPSCAALAVSKCHPMAATLHAPTRCPIVNLLGAAPHGKA